MTPLQVLIVEDDPGAVADIRRKLKRIGYVAQGIAAHGEQAMKLLALSKPDLILMNIRLAGKSDGPDFATQIKERTDLPIVFLTTNIDEVTLESARISQPYSYLRQPFQEQDLRIAIEVALYKQSAERDVRKQLERNAQRLAALNHMGQIVTSSLNLPEVLHRVTREAQALLSVDEISILLKQTGDELIFVAVSNESQGTLLGVRIPSDVGAAGEVMETGMPILIGEESQQNQIYRYVDQMTGFHTQSLLAVPLALENIIIGVVEAARPSRLGAFTKEDLHMLEGVANWAAIAIANARQYTTIQTRLQESEAIAGIGRFLLGTLNLNQVLQMIVDSAQQLIPFVDRAVIHLLEDGSQTLAMAAATGIDNLEGPFFTIQPGEGIAGKVLSEGRTINIANTQTDPAYLPLGAKNPVGSLLVAPIQSGPGRVWPDKAGSRLLGTISVRSEVVGAFSQDHERLLTILGVQAALAIDNARLFEAERKSRQLAESLLQHEKSTRAQLVQSEKLAALGRIVASVAHELNNPLQAIQNAIYLVRTEEALSLQTQEDLGVALNEANRMADLISRLRETYRPAAGEEFQMEAVNTLVEDVYKLLGTHMRHQNILFRFQPAQDLPRIFMIRDQIRQVILNLSLNAIESITQTHAGPTLQMTENASALTENTTAGMLTICTAYQSENNEAMLSFTDNGPGIPEEILPNIFDPFFTTKEGGTGLGLAITYDIVQRHKGRIQVESQPMVGTTFKIWLPAGEQAHDIAGRSAEQEQIQG